MNCPICTIALVMSERLGIEVDYCPKCRGVWLDRGELDKIIERSVPATAPEQRPPAAAPYQQEQSYNRPYDKHHDKHHGDDHDGQYHKKKRGIFDLFD
jgi:Zn-finger nucleic acid-binding protein